jgi:Sap, sulfolipid-1-addressing protein
MTGHGRRDTAAFAFFIMESVSSVAVALILFLARPRWAVGQLARLKTWLTKHSRAILLAVLGLMGGTFQRTGIGGAPALTTRLPEVTVGDLHPASTPN